MFIGNCSKIAFFSVGCDKRFNEISQNFICVYEALNRFPLICGTRVGIGWIEIKIGREIIIPIDVWRFVQLTFSLSQVLSDKI